MAKTDYQSIDEYHQTFALPIQERLQAIRETVHRIAPEATEVISYQIPAFKIGKKFLIYYCAFDNHITLSSPWSQALLQEFTTELKHYKVSKSAIQIPHKQILPLDFIEKLIAFRKAETMNIQ